MNSILSKTAKVGKNVELGQFCVIEDMVMIGENVQLGHGVIVHAGTQIGDGCVVGDYAVLGKQPFSFHHFSTKTSPQPPLVIQPSCYIGTYTLIYAGVTVGTQVYIADRVSIREGTAVGDGVRIGRCVDIDDHAQIGNGVKIQSGALIADETRIDEGVYIGAQVVTTADKYMSRDTQQRRGPWIQRNARIGSNATLLPHLTVGEESVIAAGAVIVRDVGSGLVVAGNPARVIRRVPEEQLKGKI